jgi:alkylated DNA repair dioxygenase AlkB
MKKEHENINVTFDEQFLDKDLANKLLDKCNGMFKYQNSKRSKLVFGNKGLVYTVTYQDKSKLTFAKDWSNFPDLLLVKDKLETLTGEQYNFCAIMSYPNGSAVIKKHRDKEMTLGSQICGISLGCTRRFQLTPIKTNCDPIILDLNHGSLYCLLPPTNDYWLHEILPDQTDKTRYSLTFRNVVNPLTSDDIKYCPAILKSGPKKGQKCDIIVHNQNNNFCGRHNK